MQQHQNLIAKLGKILHFVSRIAGTSQKCHSDFLVDDEGKVKKYGIKEIKLFAAHLCSQPDHTISKWHAETNFMQEEANLQVEAHYMPCPKGWAHIIMSMKNMQDEIKSKKASLVKAKGYAHKHDDAHSHL